MPLQTLAIPVHFINERLKGIETFPIADNHGPEDIALDSKGRIYAATHEGNIVRLDPDGSNPENWVNTKGRPLGIDFDSTRQFDCGRCL